MSMNFYTGQYMVDNCLDLLESLIYLFYLLQYTNFVTDYSFT